MKPLLTQDDQTRLALVQRVELAEAERDQLREDKKLRDKETRYLLRELDRLRRERDQLRKDLRRTGEAVRDAALRAERAEAERDTCEEERNAAAKDALNAIAERDQLREEHQKWQAEHIAAYLKLEAERAQLREKIVAAKNELQAPGFSAERRLAAALYTLGDGPPRTREDSNS